MNEKRKTTKKYKKTEEELRNKRSIKYINKGVRKCKSKF